MEEAQLNRSLTWIQGTAMAIGAVLGSGVLILPALTAEQAGPGSIWVWVGMSVLAFPLALTIGRLGARFPHAGGIVEYARLAFGPRTGQITGWLFIGTIPIGVPIIALIGANYVEKSFFMPSWSISLMASLMLVLSLYLNVRGVELAGWVQIFLLILIALVMLTAVLAAMPDVRLASFHPWIAHGWAQLGKSAVIIFWCFVGWEMVAHLAEEFRHPSQDLRRTFTLAPAVVGILYVGLSFVTVGAHAYGGADQGAPLSQLVGMGLGRIGSIMTGAIAFLITVVAIHGNVTGFSRMVYAQARNGDFPAILAKLHPRYQTPIVALVALGIDFAVVLTIYIVFHINLSILIKWPSVVFLVIYIIAMASAIRLFNEERGAKWMAAIPLILCVALYPFGGWAGVYPLILAAIGWGISHKKSGKGRRSTWMGKRS